MKKWGFVLLLTLCTKLWAQVPNGYYSAAEGKTGEELVSTLHSIIKDHTELSYTGLWSAFYETDKRDDGKVWDMYSTCNFTFGDDQDNGTGGTSECEYYNREHSFPRSWFGGAVAPMNTDLFHLYPTDKKVNSIRADFPYGNVSSATYTSSNGSKLGTSVSGYSGTVFEPANEYKGDFARSYFYMATRYYNQISSWNSEMLNGTNFPTYASWALNTLLQWHQNDPVSLKEIERNNVIYKDFQHNRNPYIDNPNLVQRAWVQGSTPIEFTSSPTTNANIGNTYSYQIEVNTSTSAEVSFICLVKPNWLTLSTGNNNSALLEGTPTAENIGNNYVVVLANNGETHAIQQFEIIVNENNTGLEIDQSQKIRAFPNPASSEIYVSTPNNEQSSITIISLLGFKTKSVQTIGDTTKLDVSDLPEGAYIVFVKTKYEIFSTHIIVQK